MTTASKRPDPADMDYEITTIKSVDRDASGCWTIERADGWVFGVQADSPVGPKPGMTARFYGKGIGFTVRGLVLDGTVVYYRTEAEEDARHQEECDQRDRDRRAWFEEHKADLDRRVAALPEVFRRRIDRFRAGNPDFRWEFEGYELACCETAVKIAETLATRERYIEVVNNDNRWAAVSEAVPDIDPGLSGNQFGLALNLAGIYLTEPDMVIRQHGAMVPLVGCKKYGCTHEPSGGAA